MLVLISGISGCGKSTIIKQILKDKPEYILVKSTTTRPMRLKDNESQGNPYHFVSEEEFDKLIAEDKLFEWNTIHGNKYGVTKEIIDLAKDPTKCVLKDIDVEGQQEYLQKLKNSGIKVFSVYVCLAPEILEQRLIKRGDDIDNIKLRLSRGQYENSFASNYDFVVHNLGATDYVRIARLTEYKIEQIMNEQCREISSTNTKISTATPSQCTASPLAK